MRKFDFYLRSDIIVITICSLSRKQGKLQKWEGFTRQISYLKDYSI